MGSPGIVFFYSLISRLDLITTEQKAVPFEADRWRWRSVGVGVYELQPKVLSKKMKALTIDEFRLSENRLATNAFVPCKLLVNPDHPRLDQLARLIEVRIRWEMSDKGRIAFDCKADRLAAHAALNKKGEVIDTDGFNHGRTRRDWP